VAMSRITNVYELFSSWKSGIYHGQCDLSRGAAGLPLGSLILLSISSTVYLSFLTYY
jgi:hypothetical protein